MTPADLIAEHRRLDQELDVASKLFNELCKPRKERQEQIRSQLHQMLLDLNGGAIGKAKFSTDEGTAYLSTIVTPKVVNENGWLDWILEDWGNRGPLLKIGSPVKAEFDSWVERHGAPPPFIETSSFTRVNINSSK